MHSNRPLLLLSLALSQAVAVSAQFSGFPGSFGGLGGLINNYGPPCGYTCEQALIPQQFQPWVCSDYTDTKCICNTYSNANQGLGDIISYCIRSGCGAQVAVAKDIFYNLCNATTSMTPTQNFLNTAEGTALPTPYVAQVTPSADAAAVSFAATAGITSTRPSASAFTPPADTGAGMPATASATSTPSASPAPAAAAPTKRVMTPGEIAGIAVGVVVGLVLICIIIGAIVAKTQSAKKRNPQGYYDYPHMTRPGYQRGGPPAPAYEKDIENAIHEKDIRDIQQGSNIDRSTVQELPANAPAAHEIASSSDMVKPGVGSVQRPTTTDIANPDTKTNGSTTFQFQYGSRVDQELTRCSRPGDVEAGAAARNLSASAPSSQPRLPLPPAYQPRGRASPEPQAAPLQQAQPVSLKVAVPMPKDNRPLTAENILSSGRITYAAVDPSTAPKASLPPPPTPPTSTTTTSGKKEVKSVPCVGTSPIPSRSTTPDSMRSTSSASSSVSSSSKHMSPVVSPEAVNSVPINTIKDVSKQATSFWLRRYGSTASSELVSPLNASDLTTTAVKPTGRRFPVVVSEPTAALARQQSQAIEFAKHLNVEAQQLLKTQSPSSSTTDLTAQK